MSPAKASGMHMLLCSALALGAVLMCMATRISAQSAANGAEWPTYGGTWQIPGTARLTRSTPPTSASCRLPGVSKRTAWARGPNSSWKEHR